MGTSGEVGWVLGQSGALSLRGWSRRHGIDGVVMRDGDVREQTPIQGGTCTRGLLGNSGANHYLRSLAGGKEEKLGEGRIEKKRGLSSRVHTHHPTIGLLFGSVT